MKTQKPKIRFSFKEEWKSNALKDVTTYVDYRGKTPPKSEQGIFLVTAKNIKSGYIDYEASQEYILEKDYEEVMRRGKVVIGDVLITTEAPLGNVASVDREGIALAQRVIKLRGKKEIVINNFLKYALTSPHFQSIVSQKSTGSTAKGIKGSELHKIKIFYPSTNEQAKIASFLTAVDGRLSLMKRKKELLEQYKRGVMQKIFNRELRFKTDNGEDFPEWQEAQLSNVLDYIQPTKYIVNSTDYDEALGTPVLTAGKSFVLGYTNETHGIFENVPVIIFDDFTTASKFVDFPFKVKSSAMKILTLKDSELSLKFIFEAINLVDFPTGDEHKRYWISEYSKLHIPFPEKREQNKIASFLTTIDDKIKLVEQQISHTETYKKGLLQQMFI